MTAVHGKGTYVSLNGVNLSPYTDTSEFDRSAAVHEITAYGVDDVANAGGLRSHKVSMSGTYHAMAASGAPGTVFPPLLGTTVTFIRRAEGTGTGKPQQSCSVVVADYKETNPVADYIKWAAELTVDGAVTTTTQ